MAEDKNIYSKLGVSSKKEDVHKAIEKLDKGLFPGSFCKIVEDVTGRDNYCSVSHADGAGTKSSLAYMYYKETGDSSIFKNVVRDAIIMNIDDVLCVGATGNIFLVNNLGRNSNYISGDIVATIIKDDEDGLWVDINKLNAVTLSRIKQQASRLREKQKEDTISAWLKHQTV